MRAHIGNACALLVLAACAPFTFAQGQGNGNVAGGRADGPIASAGLPAAAQELLGAYPGLRVFQTGQVVRKFYAVPMTAGQTPDQAAADWIAQHAEAFGVPNVELQFAWSAVHGLGRFTTFAYTQTVNGIPVEGSRLRLLVLDGAEPRVVYAGATLALPPADVAAAASVPADAAVADVRNQAQYSHLPGWSQPETVVFFDQDAEALQPGRLAWKFVGEQPDLSRREKYTFFVDQQSGALLAARNEVLNVNISGLVQGNATPGLAPDSGLNPPVAAAMPEIRVSVTGGNNAFSDRSGNYTIVHSGSSAVTVTTNVSGGRWVDVNTLLGSELALSQSVTPPGPGNFLFNSAPSESTTAQVNAFIHTNSIHNYIRDRGTLAGVDIAMPANTNIADVCNAYFDGGSINFFRSGGGCVNSAYSTVVAHEYGHFIVQVLGLSQGAFGEGYGDSCAVMLYDTAIIGRDFFGPGQHVRNVDTANQQYPCADEIHTCGQVLAGVWFDTKQNFKTAYGNEPGLELARQLHVDWSIVTDGSAGTGQSAHPGTAIEVLTADDDNGNLDDGTPNYTLICPAFAAHSISCPPIVPVIFEFPEGLPTQLTPGETTDVPVNVLPAGGTPTPGTGTVSYRIGSSGSFTTVPMVQGAPNQYTATLPAVPCPQTLQFYFGAGSSIGPATSPSGAPGQTYRAISAETLTEVFVDHFETNLGWTTSGTASTGQWQRGVPVNCSRGDPPSDHDGSGQCYLTQNNPTNCDSDVDGGNVRLISPSFDLTGGAAARISYWRWFSNSFGNAPFTDTFVVEVRADNGAWVPVETVGPSGPEVSGGWFYHEFNVQDFVPLTSNVQIRFTTSDDAINPSVVEAAVDDVHVVVADCNPPPPCPGDFSGNGVIDLDDLVLLLANYGSAGPDGDMDGDGDVDIEDLAAFLSVYGTTCP